MRINHIDDTLETAQMRYDALRRMSRIEASFLPTDAPRVEAFSGLSAREMDAILGTIILDSENME